MIQIQYRIHELDVAVNILLLRVSALRRSRCFCMSCVLKRGFLTAHTLGNMCVPIYMCTVMCYFLFSAFCSAVFDAESDAESSAFGLFSFTHFFAACKASAATSAAFAILTAGTEAPATLPA